VTGKRFGIFEGCDVCEDGVKNGGPPRARSAPSSTTDYLCLDVIEQPHLAKE